MAPQKTQKTQKRWELNKCEHGRYKYVCKACGTGHCKHNRQKPHCLICRPCPHGKIRYKCKECRRNKQKSKIITAIVVT